MWFCQKLLKKAKTNTQIMKIWLFLWNPHLVAPKSATSVFLAFFSIFWPKIAQKCQKTGSCRFQWYQMWISQKSPKLHNLTVIFAVFEQFSAKLHLVAHQNRTIWTFAKTCLTIMQSESGLDPPRWPRHGGLHISRLQEVERGSKWPEYASGFSNALKLFGFFEQF